MQKEGLFKLYTIDRYYLNFLYAKDKRVHNPNLYKDNRPYIGVIVNRNGVKYFVPLSSYKKDVKNKKNKNVEYVLKIINENNKKEIEYLGYIMFNNMIPCIEGVYKEISIEAIRNSKYKTLLRKQYLFIRKQETQERIQRRADITFSKVSMGDPHYLKVCCDFGELEKLSRTYSRRYKVLDNSC